MLQVVFLLISVFVILAVRLVPFDLNAEVEVVLSGELPWNLLHQVSLHGDAVVREQLLSYDPVWVQLQLQPVEVAQRARPF